MTLVEELVKLRDLQKVDTQIYQREQTLKALDSGETLKQEAIVLLKRHDAALVALHKAEGEQRDRELELKSLEEKKRMVHNKLYSGKVTNPKELDALQKDEEMIGGQISHVEDILLEIMETVETARAEETTSGKLLALAKRKWQETVAHTKAETERLQKELLALRPDRARLVALVTDRNLLRRYDDIRQHSAGIGIAITDNAVCSACHMKLTPDLIERMTEGYDVVACENCGRILARSGG